jgi:hypothetical protein
MKLPVQAQPVVRKVSIAKILNSMLVQSLFLPCAKKGEMCGGFAGTKCCSGGKCQFLPGADYGYCDSLPIIPVL